MKRVLFALLLILSVPVGVSVPVISQAAYAPLPISAEDAAHVNLENIMRSGCRRIDANASSSGTSGDWSTIDCDGVGRLWTNTELPDAVSVTATGMAVPGTAPWILAAMGCYNGSTIDLCLGGNNIAHDAAASTSNPLLIGGYANAAAPADVSADLDAVRAWFLRNGAQATVITAAGALIGGDAANGLDVDVTRVPTDPFGVNADAASATGSISAKLRFIASTGIPITGTVATTITGTVAHDGAASAVNPFLVGGYANAAAPADVSADLDAVRAWFLRNGAQAIQPTFAGVLATTGNGASGTGVQRVTLANDSTGTVIATQATGTNLHMVCDGGTCGGITTFTHDAALTVGSTAGVPAVGRASAAAPTDVSADNDAVLPWHLRSGANVSQPSYGGVLAVAGNGASGTGVQRVTIASDSTGVLGAIGTIAHDGVDSGNPVKIGAKASNALSGLTLVANADRTDLYAGLDGALLVREHANLEDRVSGVASITDGSSTSVVAAQGASTRFCATTLIVSNSSATNVTVDIRDGTAGSVIATIPAGANMGGAAIPLAVPLCTTANTIFAADPSASATTVAVTAVGFKTKL